MGEGADEYQILKYAHLGISFWGFPILGTVNQMGIELWGAPQVAYNEGGASNAKFMLAWQYQIDGNFYTLGKTVTPGSRWDWSTLRLHSTGASTFGYTPSIGTANVYYELQAQSR